MDAVATNKRRGKANIKDGEIFLPSISDNSNISYFSSQSILPVQEAVQCVSDKETGLQLERSKEISPDSQLSSGVNVNIVRTIHFCLCTAKHRATQRKIACILRRSKTHHQICIFLRQNVMSGDPT